MQSGGATVRRNFAAHMLLREIILRFGGVVELEKGSCGNAEVRISLFPCRSSRDSKRRAILCVANQPARQFRQVLCVQRLPCEQFFRAGEENRAIAFENIARRPKGVFDEGFDHTIDFVGRILAIGPRPPAARPTEEAAVLRFVDDLAELLRHAEANDHVACNVRGLREIVGGARRHFAEMRASAARPPRSTAMRPASSAWLMMKRSSVGRWIV